MVNKTKNILVALDFSSLDEKLIQYVSVLSDEMSTDKIFFVHNIKKHEISEVFAERLKQVNLEEIIGEKIKEKVEQAYTGKAEHEILISEDSSTEGIISYIANKYQIGLTICGNKNNKKGIGTVSGKLLRILKCDILTVPEEARLPIDNLIVATDFSRNSHKAVVLANKLALSKGADLSCLNIYKVPQAYFPYLNLKDAREKLEQHTEKQFDKLQKKLELQNIQRLMLKAGDASIGERIREVAEKQNCDILFLADKGHSGIVSLLVGSVTEEVFTHDLHVPLWVVK